nr:unnamed protein product [Digitaria exilis]
MGGRWAMTPVAGEERTEAMGEVARRRRFTTGAGVAGHLRHRRGRRAGQRRGRARVPRQPRQAQFPRVCHAPPPPDLDAGDGGGDDYLRLEALLESQTAAAPGSLAFPVFVNFGGASASHQSWPQQGSCSESDGGVGYPPAAAAAAG